MQTEIEMRLVVTDLFAKARQNKDAPFESDRFLAFLTDPPACGRHCADTFCGRRRFVRFMHSVQLTFRICFTQKEWDRAYRMEEFVSLIVAKAAKPTTALRLAEQRFGEARREAVDSPVKFALIALPLLVGVLVAKRPLLRIFLAAISMAIVGGISLLAWREFFPRAQASGSNSSRRSI